MVDPREYDTNAIVQKIGITQMATQRAISAYRNNILLPDVHQARLGDMTPVESVGEDGQPMTPERRRQLMEGKKPWIENPQMDRRNLLSEEELPTEELGLAEIARRKGIRRVTPVELTEELMAQRQPADCAWTSGSDAGYDLAHIVRYVMEAKQAIEKKGRMIDCLVMSREAAKTIDYLVRITGDLQTTPILQGMSFVGVHVRLDDAQEHHVQLWATGFPRQFASIFIHRELLRRVREDETQVIDIITDK